MKYFDVSSEFSASSVKGAAAVLLIPFRKAVKRRDEGSNDAVALNTKNAAKYAAFFVLDCLQRVGNSHPFSC
jgi:hypothetical protein